MSAGVSLLAAPAFLPPDSAGRNWFNNFRGAWMVISYMFVLEVHTGATLKMGFWRMCGTFVGAVTAYVFDAIAGTNPYGLVALAITASIFISYGVKFSSKFQFATVA